MTDGTTGAPEDQQLSRNTAVMAAGTTLSRITGFGRVFALAYALNFGRLGDAYNLANTVPNIVYDLVLGGVLSATLVPVFVTRLQEDDPDEAWRAISAVVSAALIVLVALSAVFVALAPLVIRVYTLLNRTDSVGPQRAVATQLLRWFAPQVFLLGAIALSTAVLNARRHFAAPTFSPVVNNLVTIVVLLLTPTVARSLDLSAITHDPKALAFLGIGTTAGYFAQAAIQLPWLGRTGARIRWVWNLRHPAVRAVLRLSTWTFGFVIANQVAFFIVLLLAEQRDGGVSAYSAAYLFFQLPFAIFAVSVMTALQPGLAARWSAGEIDDFGQQLSHGIRLTAAVMVPAGVGYAILARPIVILVLQHGRLSHSAALLTADTLSLLALGLAGFSAYLLLIRAYQAMQDTRAAFWLYLVENGVNIVLALALFPWLGVQGLGMALSVAYTVGTVVAVRGVARRGAGLETSTILQSLARVLIATAAMAIVAFVVSDAIGSGSDARIVVRLGAAVGAGATVYLVVARALGVDELVSLLRLRRRSASPS